MNTIKVELKADDAAELLKWLSHLPRCYGAMAYHDLLAEKFRAVPAPEPEPPYLKERPFGTWPTPKLGWCGPVLCQWCENHRDVAQGWWVEVPQIHP